MKRIKLCIFAVSILGYSCGKRAEVNMPPLGQKTSIKALGEVSDDQKRETLPSSHSEALNIEFEVDLKSTTPDAVQFFGGDGKLAFTKSWSELKSGTAGQSCVGKINDSLSPNRALICDQSLQVDDIIRIDIIVDGLKVISATSWVEYINNQGHRVIKIK